MWIEGNYRRNLMDMHIDDWNPEFLSKINIAEYVNALKSANIQAAMVKGKPHTGLCYYPTKIGRMHKGLKEFDFFGNMIEKCHENNISVIAYFTQIFDNWAYEEHPDWRVITAEGKNMREYNGQPNFKTGRYGIVCPNNKEYREYVKACLTEMNTMYDFEGMFLDMTFWPEVCYCPSCRKRYKEEMGKELPRTIDWNDFVWKEYVYKRDEWMADYAKFATKCVKSIKPKVTIEHQFSRITGSWVDGSTEMLTEAVDYAGGDYYGGFLQQTFINKYYKNVSPNLPFIYHTSRCDPELIFHTTTKTEEEIMLHVITALVHNGAFLLVDAINPDGSIVPEVYHDLMKRIYGKTSQYEKYINGNLYHDASIWFASHAKYDPNECNIDVVEKSFEPKYYMESPVSAASVMRENNIPFEVIGTKNISSDNAKVLVLSHVANIREEEMDEIEKYIKNGGNLYISGPIANDRLQKILGVRVIGRTPHDFTYMSPTKFGEELFDGFTRQTPLTVTMSQIEIEIISDENMTVLATQTLPYTMTNTYEFAAIHSNPPGIYTNMSCAILKEIGTSKIIWTAAPIEMSKPYMSRQVFKRMIQLLVGEPTFVSNAPKFVEVLSWNKEGTDYFAVINEQEESPIAPMYDITIDIKKTNRKAYMLPNKEEIKTEMIGKDLMRIYLPKLEVFQMIALK
ncbi:putative glycosyl hydrolase-like family 6 (GHL6) protein [Lachnotalea glycerini]|uniref:Putative glycosyl hydrolase-like family 6 (GHL6) protein n=1 Tax=Lachnotalea glycerini TaxID=1763509 RepID=A0A318ER11_9FIRM|nr:family 10 glycosylhydrolase [Lachnotalea glycerini]PXV93396.1 putative glycosyl hydrolase-like family 6 (GHL6) protein [Lachnotalea glycerini]